MLNQIFLRNFVNFKDEQSLKFEDRDNGKVFVFVGANGSGKSSMFEAVRRCSDIHLNKSPSNRVDVAKESIVVCLFERAGEKMASYYMAWNDGESSSVSEVKMILKPQDSNNKPMVIMAWSDGDSSLNKWRCHMYSQQNMSNELRDILLERAKNVNEDKQKMQSFLNDAVEKIKVEHELHKNETRNVTTETSNVTTEKFDEEFSKFVCVEFLFGYRGLSLTQSSHQMETENKQSVRATEIGKHGYDKSNGKSFVINDFLKDETESKYNKALEREIFSLITSTKDLVFETDRGEIKIAKGLKKAKLLKAPEGIVEAKFLSVLLAKKDVTTLLIEEPGRGMHKNFTDIVINRVFSEEKYTKRKTVIFTTHNRDFLTRSILLNTTFFSKEEDGTCKTNILSHEYENKTLGFVTSNNVSTIFFSKYSIIVEGTWDAMFVEAVKNILLRDDRMLRIAVDNSELETIKNFLSTLNVVELDGEKSKRHVELVCQDLSLEKRRLYLFDGDTRPKIKKELNLDETVETTNDSLEKIGVFLWSPTADILPKTEEKEKTRSPPTKRAKRRNSSGKEDNNTEPGTRESEKKRNIKEGTIEHAMLETVQLHIDEHHKTESCTIQDCKAMAQIKEFKKGKQLFKEAQGTDDIQVLIRTPLEISLAYKRWDIWRFIQFLKTNSGIKKY